LSVESEYHESIVERGRCNSHYHWRKEAEIVFVEHDPMLYEDAQEMAEYVSRLYERLLKDKALR